MLLISIISSFRRIVNDIWFKKTELTFILCYTKLQALGKYKLYLHVN